MEGRTLLYCLVVASLPALSLQALTKTCPNGYRNDYIYLFSEESENAIFSSQSASYAELDGAFAQYFADAAQAGYDSATAEIFSTDRGVAAAPIVWMQPNNVVGADGLLPTRRSDGGAVVLDGTSRIETTLSGSFARRVVVPIVYASQLRTTFPSVSVSDITNIIEFISRMRARNVDIYFFAIGSAVTDPALVSFQTQTQATFGRQVVYNVALNSDIGNLAQMLTDATLDCNTNVAPVATAAPAASPVPGDIESLCEQCLITESSGLIPHPERCDWFIHCYRLSDDLPISWTFKQCSGGTLYDNSTHVCAHDYNVLAATGSSRNCNWCTSLGQRFSHVDKCSAYFECVESNRATEFTLEQKCCPDNQRFDDASRTCVTDASCPRCCDSGTEYNEATSTCVPVVLSEPCNFQSRPDGCSYDVIITGINFGTIQCASGTYFNASECGCLTAPDDSVCLAISARDSQVCNPDVIITFGTNQTNLDGFDEASNNVRYVDVEGNVVFNNGRAELDGSDSFVIVKYYALNTEGFQGDVAFFRVHVKDNQTPSLINEEMIVLSNHPCDGSEGRSTVLMTLHPSRREAVFGVKTSQGYTNLTIPYGSQSDGAWKEMTLRYSQSGLLEGSLRTYSGTEANRNPTSYIQQLEQSENVPGGGRIATSTCGLKVGKGASYHNYFNGQVDLATFYDDCPVSAAPPAVDATLTIPE